MEHTIDFPKSESSQYLWSRRGRDMASHPITYNQHSALASNICFTRLTRLGYMLRLTCIYDQHGNHVEARSYIFTGKPRISISRVGRGSQNDDRSSHQGRYCISRITPVLGNRKSYKTYGQVKDRQLSYVMGWPGAGRILHFLRVNGCSLSATCCFIPPGFIFLTVQFGILLGLTQFGKNLNRKYE